MRTPWWLLGGLVLACGGDGNTDLFENGGTGGAGAGSATDTGGQSNTGGAFATGGAWNPTGGTSTGGSVAAGTGGGEPDGSALDAGAPDARAPDASEPDGAAPDASAFDSGAADGANPPPGMDGGPGPDASPQCSPESMATCTGNATAARLVCSGGVWIPDTCPAGENCDTAPGVLEGTCQPIVPDCFGQSPGTVVCSGKSRLECGPDLVSTTSLGSCPFVCTGGACTGSCEPGTRQCVGAVPQICDTMGAWQSVTVCTGACVSGACVGTCLPGATACNGQVTQVCDATGTWQDGPACSGQACDNGICVGVCEPGATQCSQNGVETCDSAGQWGASSPCTTQACVNGVCTGVCEPGTTQCSGNAVETCTGAGQWGAGSPCTDQICTNGVCTGECSPGTSQCSGLVPQTCDGAGTWQDGAPCASVCIGGACSGTCSPGEPRCNGQTPQTCDGTGNWQDGVACSNQACVNGACTGVCAPNGKQCSGNDVETCDQTGQWGAPVPCTSSACVSGVCTGVCVPNDTQCAGNAVQNCDASGQWGTTTVCGGGTPQCDAATAACVQCTSATQCPATSNPCQVATCTSNTCGTGNAPPATPCVGGTCSGGACGCDADHANCDGMLVTGCETDTATDPANCGGCGVGCGNNQTCDGGQCSTGSRCTAGANGPPNVVIVMTDDLDEASFDLLLENGLLPNIQQYIIDRGTRFSESFVSNSLCCPSRATLLTGEYSHNNGVISNANGFGLFTPHQNNTLATHLKAAGYRTAYIGKYLNGYGSASYHAPGWDEWHALLEPYVYYMWGFRIVRSIDGAATTTITYNGGSTARSANNYQTDVLAQIGATFVTTAAEPFAAVVMPLAPHAEVLPGTSLDTRTEMRALRTRPSTPHYGQLRATLGGGGIDDDTPISPEFDIPHKPLASFNEADISDKPNWLKNGVLGGGGWASLTATDISYQTRQHLDRLESMLSVDDMVGTLYAALAARGVADDTLIIVSSDNGFMLGEHRLNNKMFPHEDSIRVPLAVGCGASSGIAETRYVLNNDLAPTLMDYAGAPWAVDGRSLRALIDGTPVASWRKRVLVEHWINPNSPYPYQEASDHAVVRTSTSDSTPEHTYVGYYGNTGVLNQSSVATELEQYDNVSDPTQLTSVATNPAYATQRAALAPKLQALRLCAGATCQTAED